MWKERTSNYSQSRLPKSLPNPSLCISLTLLFRVESIRKRSFITSIRKRSFITFKSTSSISSSTIYVTPILYVTFRWRRCRRTAFLEQQTKPRISFSLSLGKVKKRRVRPDKQEPKTERRVRSEGVERTCQEVYQLMNSLRSLERQ